MEHLKNNVVLATLDNTAMAIDKIRNYVTNITTDLLWACNNCGSTDCLCGNTDFDTTN